MTTTAQRIDVRLVPPAPRQAPIFTTLGAPVADAAACCAGSCRGG